MSVRAQFPRKGRRPERLQDEQPRRERRDDAVADRPSVPVGREAVSGVSVHRGKPNRAGGNAKMRRAGRSSSTGDRRGTRASQSDTILERISRDLEPRNRSEGREK